AGGFVVAGGGWLVDCGGWLVLVLVGWPDGGGGCEVWLPGGGDPPGFLSSPGLINVSTPSTTAITAMPIRINPAARPGRLEPGSCMTLMPAPRKLGAGYSGASSLGARTVSADSLRKLRRAGGSSRARRP